MCHRNALEHWRDDPESIGATARDAEEALGDLLRDARRLVDAVNAYSVTTWSEREHYRLAKVINRDR